LYTGEHYSLFIVRHVGTAWLDTLVLTRSTRPTCRVVSRHDEPSGIWAFMGKLSTMGQPTRSTRPSNPPGSWVAIHGLSGVQVLYGKARLCTAVRLQVKVRVCRLGMQPIGCMPALSVTQKLQLQYAVCGPM